MADSHVASEPDYGPSLPALLRPRLRALRGWQRAALVAVIALVVIGAAALVIRKESEVATYSQSEQDARARGLPPLSFHFDRVRTLQTSKPNGAYIQLERTVDGRLSARFTVSPMKLEPHAGLLSGYLPILATELERGAARRYENFRLQFEGRARVNAVEGYQYAFTARVREPGHAPRVLFGRVVMLPEPYDTGEPDKPYPTGETPTRGVLITMLATTLDAADAPIRVGDEGVLQRSFRSFRFGAG